MSASGPVEHSVIVTIDGPAGTGKSTVAAELARRIGVEFLDTGAMYRAAALLALERGIDPSDGPALSAAVRDVGIRFDFSAERPTVLLGDRDGGRPAEQQPRALHQVDLGQLRADVHQEHPPPDLAGGASQQRLKVAEASQPDAGQGQPGRLGHIAVVVDDLAPGGRHQQLFLRGAGGLLEGSIPSST